MKSQGVWFLLFLYLISCQSNISYQTVVISSDNNPNLSRNGSDIKLSKFQEKAEISGKNIFGVDNGVTNLVDIDMDLEKEARSHVLQVVNTNRHVTFTSKLVANEPLSGKSGSHVVTKVNRRLPWASTIIGLSKQTRKSIKSISPIVSSRGVKLLKTFWLFRGRKLISVAQHNKVKLDTANLISKTLKNPNYFMKKPISSAHKTNLFQSKERRLGRIPIILRKRSVNSNPLNVTINSVLPNKTHDPSKDLLVSNQILSIFNTKSAGEMSVETTSSIIPVITESLSASTQHDTQKLQFISTEVNGKSKINENNAIKVISAETVVTTQTDTKSDQPVEGSLHIHTELSTPAYNLISTSKLISSSTNTKSQALFHLEPTQSSLGTTMIPRPLDITTKLHGNESATLINDISNMLPSKVMETTSKLLLKFGGSSMNPDSKSFTTYSPTKPSVVSTKENILMTEGSGEIPSGTTNVIFVSGRTTENPDVNTIVSDIIEKKLNSIQSETTATSMVPDAKNTVTATSETSTITETTLSNPTETGHDSKSTSNPSSGTKSVQPTGIDLITESLEIKLPQPTSSPVINSSASSTTKEIPVFLYTHSKQSTMTFTQNAELPFVTTMVFKQSSYSNLATRTHSSTIVERSSATAALPLSITTDTPVPTKSQIEIEQNQNVKNVNGLEKNIINPLHETSHEPVTMSTKQSSAITSSAAITTSSTAPTTSNTAPTTFSTVTNTASTVPTTSSTAPTTSNTATTTASTVPTTSSIATTASSIVTTTVSTVPTTSSIATTASGIVTTTRVLVSAITNLPIPVTNAPTAASPEPESEYDMTEPPSLAEPGPDWLIAKEQWNFAWEVHLYFFGSIFALLGLYCLVSIVRLWTFNRLLSKKYFVTLNVLIFLMCALRSVYLLVDGYNSNGTYHVVIDYLLYSTAFPCLTSAFSILMFALLQATRMQIVPPSVQKFQVLIVIIILHFVFSITTDVVIGLVAGMQIMLFVCQLVFILWGLFLFFGYAYIFRQVYGSAVKRQKMFYYSGSPKSLPNAQSKNKLTLSLAVKITFGTAIFGLITVGLEIYGIAGVYGIFSDKKPDPWPWWSYHTVLRLTECLMCLTISYIASQPFRYRNAKQMCNCCFLCAPCINMFSCDTTGKFSENIGWSDTENCANNFSTSLPLSGKKRITLCDVADIIPIVIQPSSNTESQPTSLLIIEDGYVRFPTDNDINKITESYNGIKRQTASIGIVNGAYQGQDINNKNSANEIKLTHYNRKGSMASSEPFRSPSSISLADSMVSELDKAFKSMRDDDIAPGLQNSINNTLNDTCCSVENTKNIDAYLEGQSKSVKSISLRRSNSEAGEINAVPSLRAKLYRSQSDSSGAIRTKQFDNMRYMSLLDLEQTMLDDNGFHSEDNVDFSREDVYVKNPEILRQCSIVVEAEGLLRKHSDQVTEL